MKTFKLLLALVISSGLTSSRAQDTWTQKADFGGGAIAGAVGFSINDKGYVGAFGTAAFWQYDPASDIWTQMADFGGGSRGNAVGFCIGSKGYLGTGSSNISPYLAKDFWEYDPEANTWTQKADFGGGERCCATGFSIGNKGFIGTGIPLGYGELVGDFWEYDPVTDLWTQKAYYGEMYDAVGFTIGNKGYIGGGRDWYDSFGYFTEYDPDADTWTGKADVGRRAEAVGFSIGNKGYIGLGNNLPTPYEDEHIFNDILEYDPASDTWSKGVIFLGGARYAAFGFSIGSKGYLGTGYTNVVTKDFWEFNPAKLICTVPADESTVNITGTSAKLNWDIVGEAKRYNIRYRAAGTNEWIILTNIISNSKVISGLVPNTLYFWQAKSICSAIPIVSSEWSAKQSFTTGAFRLSDEQTVSLDLYPNPVTESFTLDLQLGTTTDQSATIYLLNALGQTVHASMEVVNGELNKVITMPGTATSGWYLVRVVLSDQVIEQKLLYQK
ncbi:MAG: T9SS type A sorting domain-containing protein [Chitinophagaceae bacterium]|nr:T9SS type A sorting domain-containing protein [Chitinophagaceae bacterium]